MQSGTRKKIPKRILFFGEILPQQTFVYSLVLHIQGQCGWAKYTGTLKQFTMALSSGTFYKNPSKLYSLLKESAQTDGSDSVCEESEADGSLDAFVNKQRLFTIQVAPKSVYQDPEQTPSDDTACNARNFIEME